MADISAQLAVIHIPDHCLALAALSGFYRLCFVAVFGLQKYYNI
ncbi:MULTISPECIES: hypothetical protein [unclassified Nodularia (in: cyanobacteria)]|nr:MULTISPECIES: hypothetical protein [unclassified Nodularia (in: cyanobacteria)]